MGDRGNIVVLQHPHQEPEGALYLYTHWGGGDLPLTLKLALHKASIGELGSRLDDEGSLTRIIFERMLMQEEPAYRPIGADGTHGFRITTYLCDNDHPMLVVDCMRRQVWLAAPFGNPLEPLNDVRWSFDEFIGMEHPNWESLAPERQLAALEQSNADRS
jgi:hypothetical protein